MFQFFDSVLKQINSRDLDSQEKLFLILCLGHKFSSTEEFSYLTKSNLLQELWKLILDEKESATSRKLCWQLIHLLTYLGVESKDNVFLPQIFHLVSKYLEELAKSSTITQRGIQSKQVD